MVRKDISDYVNKVYLMIIARIKKLGLSLGICFFLQGVKVTKSKGFISFNVACKWKRKILGVAPEEGWFILTNLRSAELSRRLPLLG